jgi:hypothetical protein
MVYWETAEESPLVAEQVKFAQIWKALPKVVFSTTLESVVGNTRLARDGIGEEVARLKEQPGKDIAVDGAGLARACMKPGPDRRVAAVREPGPTRQRYALLPSLEKGTDLELIETRTFGSRVVYLRYRRASDHL